MAAVLFPVSYENQGKVNLGPCLTLHTDSTAEPGSTAEGVNRDLLPQDNT